MSIRNRLLQPKAMVLAMVLAAFAFYAADARGGERGLEVTVDITPEMKARTGPGQTVFVFAKATRGPRAPLAAVKATVGDLPMTVTLDDSMALTPMFRLSRFDNVEVSARVSRSGQAMRRSGDLEGVAPNIALGESAAAVTVVIDHVVP